jgi:hypothetical protein
MRRKVIERFPRLTIVTLGSKSHGPAWDANTHQVVIFEEKSDAFVSVSLGNWIRGIREPSILPKYAWEIRTSRFPRLPRFPRFTGRKERDKDGTLKCICGKKGRIFSTGWRYKMRGFCSNECREFLKEMLDRAEEKHGA